MIKWSASKIDAANYCRMKYYLKYVEKEKPLRLSVYAKGSLSHKLIEEFWQKLGTEDEVRKRNSKKKYFDAESFGNYAYRRWTKLVVGDLKLREKSLGETDEGQRARIQSRLIYWRNEEERWIIRAKFPKICAPLYEKLVNEGPPAYSELKFDFSLGGRRFSGIIDSVKKGEGVVIRDYKSGKPWIGEMKLKHDPQLTMYNLGLCSLCYGNDKESVGFAETLGVGKERERFMGNPVYINPDFRHEFFMIESCDIHPAERRDEHFFELLKMIEGTEKAVGDGNIYPERGRKCDYCDMKVACDRKSESVSYDIPRDEIGQGFFNFAAPLYIKPAKPKVKQRRFKWKK